jgi:hypothetical protein
MTEEHFVENPAINPTRTWRRDASTVTEAHLLIKGLSSREREILIAIAQSDENLAAHGQDVSRSIDRINSFCEAFGFVNLIESRDGEISLTADARATVHDAMGLG